MKEIIRKRIEELQNRIYDLARKAGRNPEEIIILGATKGVSIEKIEAAIQAGIRYFGENTVQEADRKIPLIGDRVEWHMIGHLQRNKVKKAVRLFHVIESLDSIRLAKEIEKRVSSPIDCLIEVNTSGEFQKYGVGPEEVVNFFQQVASFEKIRIKGLMTVGPYPPSQERSKASFRMLRLIKDRLEKIFKVDLPILSMGMSEDFEWAVEEGATILRIGRAIFGERS